MKTWIKLLENEFNDVYNMYDNPEDILNNYKFALIDLAHGDIYEVSNDKTDLENKFTINGISGFEISQPAILDIEKDEVYVPTTTFEKVDKFNIG